MFRQRGIQVDILNATKGVHPAFNGNIGLTSFHPNKLLNVFISLLQFRQDWKRYLIRTTYAFQQMSRYVSRFLRQNCDHYDLILQSGCLFGVTEFQPSIPYALYIDQTYQISKRYKSIPGRNGGVVAAKRWEQHERSIYQKASHIFTMSEYAKTSLLDDYFVSQDKVKVVGAGPNLREIPTPNEKRLHRSKVLLFVGVDFVRKGGPQLLEAFMKVRHAHPTAELHIVGPDLKTSHENVILRGFLGHETMSKVYSDASLFVMPTLQEPFGLAFLEAMAYQLPCIGTNVEAIPEIIDHDSTGFLVTPGDVEQLSRAIITLLNSPDLMKEMGMKGYQRILERYNWNTVADEITEEFL